MKRKRPVRKYDLGGPVLGSSLNGTSLSGNIQNIGLYSGTYAPSLPTNISGLNGLNIGASLLNLGLSALSGAQTTDTSLLGEQIDNSGYNTNSGSIDSLLKDWSSWTKLDNVSWQDIRAGNVGTATLSAGKSALSGATAGAALGPVGAVVGGAIGAISSGIGSLFGRKKAKRLADKLNLLIDAANERLLNTFNTAATALNTQLSWLNMASSYAYGGPISSSGSKAIEYGLSLEDLYNKWLKASSTDSTNKLADGGPIWTPEDVDNPVYSKKKPLSIKELEEIFIKEPLKRGVLLFSKAAKIAMGIARLHPATAIGTDIADIIRGIATGDADEIITNGLGLSGRAIQKDVSNSTSTKTRSRGASSKALGRATGLVFSIPDIIDDATTLIEDVKRPVSEYADGGNINEFLDNWNTARLGTGRYDHQLGNGLLESLRDNREGAKVVTNPASFARMNTILPEDDPNFRTVFNQNYQTAKLRGGQYLPASNTIYVNKLNQDPTAKTHEDSHAAQALPQESAISLILGTSNDSSYLDRPTEVYSRLQQFREANNIDPLQVWDKKSIKGLRKKGALDYDLINRYSDDLLEQLFNDVAMNTNNILDAPLLLAEGGFHIKKKNRGKFTEYCGGDVTLSCIDRGKASSNPTTRKRAVFAENARSWSHAMGGLLYDEGGNLHADIPNRFQHGGEFSNGITVFDEGGTHELNPYGGIPISIGEDGVPNLVEEGEVKFGDYIFSDRLMADGSLLDFFNLPSKYNKRSFAKIAKDLLKESSERPEDPISKRGLMDSMAKLSLALETFKAGKDVDDSNVFAEGGEAYAALKRNRDNPNLGNTSRNNWLDPSHLRYAPAIGAGISSLTDAIGSTNRPDFSEANAVRDSFIPIEALTISDYMTYTPLDRNYYINSLNSAAGATRRGLRDASGGNRGVYQAGLLAADYNYGNALGQLGRQAEEYNAEQRARVADFNRSTNLYNAQARQAANTFNSLGTSLARVGAAQLRALEKARSAQARSQNLSNLFQALGDIGSEEFSRNMITSNPALYYNIDRTGKVNYKKDK